MDIADDEFEIRMVPTENGVRIHIGSDDPYDVKQALESLLENINRQLAELDEERVLN